MVNFIVQGIYKRRYIYNLISRRFILVSKIRSITLSIHFIDIYFIKAHLEDDFETISTLDGLSLHTERTENLF